MTIEEKINDIVKNIPLWEYKNINYWKWRGKPMSILHEEIFSDEVAVDNLIKECDDTECLTSQVVYIRECKKYFMKEEKK